MQPKPSKLKKQSILKTTSNFGAHKEPTDPDYTEEPFSPYEEIKETKRDKRKPIIQKHITTPQPLDRTHVFEVSKPKPTHQQRFSIPTTYEPMPIEEHKQEPKKEIKIEKPEPKPQIIEKKPAQISIAGPKKLVQRPQPQQSQQPQVRYRYEQPPQQPNRNTNYRQHHPQVEQYVDPYQIEEGENELSPEQIEEYLNQQDQRENPVREGDEREFMGGKKLYDRQLMQQPIYEEPNMQILNDIASDESFPILVQYITQLSHLGRQAQARLIVRAAAFQSKNQVFSNIQNQNDYMMAQDDYMYAQILSKADYSTYDMNSDYFTAEAVMEAQFNIRLRRSRNALNLLQINTQRQESIMSAHGQQDEERKLSRKIPFLGQYMN